MNDWSAGLYLRFEDERTRAAVDLLAQVRLAEPKYVVDIGCGPGNSTEILAARWPSARVAGFDTSPDMLAAARKRLPSVHFFAADTAVWRPEGDEDVLFSNAVFQWVPDHLDVLVRLLGGLRPGAVLAVQMPDNFEEPSHLSMREAAEEGPWKARLPESEMTRRPLPEATVYYDRLKPLSSRVEIWRTEYFFRLDGIPAVIEWLKGTGLRPYLDRLGGEERAGFLDAYRRRLEAAYPLQSDGSVLLPFPRLFVVATRG